MTSGCLSACFLALLGFWLKTALVMNDMRMALLLVAFPAKILLSTQISSFENVTGPSVRLLVGQARDEIEQPRAAVAAQPFARDDGAYLAEGAVQIVIAHDEIIFGPVLDFGAGILQP